MVEKKETSQIVKILIGECALIIYWVIYFGKFSKFYTNTEMLISDSRPLIDKLVIFVTYSKEKSINYFSGGFILVLLLLGTAAIALDNRLINRKGKLAKTVVMIIAFGNSFMVLSLFKPMIYPIYLVFVLVSMSLIYTVVTYYRIPDLMDNDYYIEDYEESYEENNEGKTTK